MMDPADSVFVGLLALLYSALSALCWLADPAPVDPYAFLDTPQPEAIAPASSAAPAPPRPGVFMELPEVVFGDFPASLVVTSIEAQRHAVRSCWEGTPGRVVVTLVIDDDGEAIAFDNGGLGAVGACVAARLEEGSFVRGPSAYVVSQAVVFGVRE